MTRLVARARSNLYSVAVRNSCTNFPLAAAGAQEDETILGFGISGQAYRRFVHLDPPGLIGSWKNAEFGLGAVSGGLHNRALDDDAGVDVFPQRDEQLAGKRHDHWFTQATAVALHAVVEPACQRGVGLIAQPEPCQLDHGRSKADIAGFGDTLLVPDGTALPWCRR